MRSDKKAVEKTLKEASSFRDFLETFKCSQLIPPNKSFHLAKIKSDDLVLDGIRKMVHTSVASLAIVDEEGKCVGWLDAVDVCSIIYTLKQCGLFADVFKNPSDLDQDKLQEENKDILEKKVKDVVKIKKGSFVSIDRDSPFIELLEIFAIRELHRVAVTSEGQVVGVVSPSDCTNFLKNTILKQKFFEKVLFYHLIPKSDFTVQKKREILTCVEKEKVIEAYGKMLEKRSSALAVVDKKGVLVSVLSANDFFKLRLQSRVSFDGTNESSDIENLFDELNGPVCDYLDRANKYFPGIYARNPIIVDMKKDFVFDVLRKFSEFRCLFEVNDQGCPIGVWSLADVLAAFIDYNGKSKKKTVDKK